MSNRLVFDIDQLKERCEEVNPIDARTTVAALVSKLNKYKDLYALCAPQIGIKERVICIKFNNNKIKAYINPRILKSEGVHLVRERDISIPEKDYICPRPNKIIVSYQTDEARPEENILEGVVAEVFDRMQNYLDGITLEDFGLEVIEGWDDATDEERQAIIDLYLKSLASREQAINEAIEQDEEAKQLRDAIRFMEAAEKGEITFGDENSIIHHDDVQVQ